MKPARRQAYLIVLAALAIAAGVIVLARARGLNDHLLAAVAVLGGLAILITALPGDDS